MSFCVFLLTKWLLAVFGNGEWMVKAVQGLSLMKFGQVWRNAKSSMKAVLGLAFLDGQKQSLLGT